MTYEGYQRFNALLADSDQINQMVWRMYLAHAQYAVDDGDLCDDLISLAGICGFHGLGLVDIDEMIFLSRLGPSVGTRVEVGVFFL